MIVQLFILILGNKVRVLMQTNKLIDIDYIMYRLKELLKKKYVLENLLRREYRYSKEVSAHRADKLFDSFIL